MITKADIESIQMFVNDYDMEIPDPVASIIHKGLQAERVRLTKNDKTNLERYLNWFLKRNQYILSDYEKVLINGLIHNID